MPKTFWTPSYSTYRLAVPVKPDDTIETYFERLCEKFEKNTIERKEQFRAELIEKHISIEEIIHGNSELIKNNAQQLAEALLDFWSRSISSKDKHYIQTILANDSSLEYIKEMYQKLFKKYNLAKHIADKIRRYIDSHNKADLPYEIIADISTELLNKFINTVGFEYLDNDSIKELKTANENNKLGLVIEQNTNNDINSVAELFSKIENQVEIINSKPEEMRNLPSYKNYISWTERLKIGFVSVCNIPNYDIKANAKLGRIIEKTQHSM